MFNFNSRNYGSSFGGRVMEGSVGASSFAWFLSGFEWFLCPMSDNKHKTSRSIAKYLRRGVLARSVLKIFINRKINRTHGETGRIEPKWGDLPVGWRETTGLQNISMRWFQPQLKFIYYYQMCESFFFCGLISSF